MTVEINWDEQRIKLQVQGDIYEEQAECLRDMVQAHVRRGIKEVNIQLCATYYISKKGRQYLYGLQRQGVQVSLAK